MRNSFIRTASSEQCLHKLIFARNSLKTLCLLRGLQWPCINSSEAKYFGKDERTLWGFCCAGSVKSKP